MKSLNAATLKRMAAYNLSWRLSTEGLEILEGQRYAAAERADARFDLFDASFEPPALLATLKNRSEALSWIAAKIQVERMADKVLLRQLARARECESEAKRDLSVATNGHEKRSAQTYLEHCQAIAGELERVLSERSSTIKNSRTP